MGKESSGERELKEKDSKREKKSKGERIIKIHKKRKQVSMVGN